jgi:hypothetical protein
LETQSKQFISRLGGPLCALSLSEPSQTYYSALLADNSIKVIRFDNNKTRVHIRGVMLDRDTIAATETSFMDGNLVVPH